MLIRAMEGCQDSSRKTTNDNKQQLLSIVLTLQIQNVFKIHWFDLSLKEEKEIIIDNK